MLTSLWTNTTSLVFDLFKDGFFSFTLLNTLSFKISHPVFLQTFSARGDCFPPVTLFSTHSHLVSTHTTVKLPLQGHQVPTACANGQFSVFAVSVAVSTVTHYFLGTGFSDTTLHPNLLCRLLFLYPSFKCCYSWRVLFASYDTAFPRIWHHCFSYNLLMVPRLLGFGGVYPAVYWTSSFDGCGRLQVIQTHFSVALG